MSASTKTEILTFDEEDQEKVDTNDASGQDDGQEKSDKEEESEDRKRMKATTLSKSYLDVLRCQPVWKLRATVPFLKVKVTAKMAESLPVMENNNE